MSADRSDEERRALVELCLTLGDTALVLGHRLSEWSSRAPTLEEDIALSNIGLDLLGQARSLLTYAGEVEGAGRDEDALAYLRDAGAYRNLLLVEHPNGDFATTMLRQFLHDARAVELWDALSSSSDATVAGVAAKAAKESAYHVEHSASWVIRLGDGTDESHRRLDAALDELWMFTGEMFADTDVDRTLAEAGVTVLPSTLAPAWRERVAAVLTEATLPVPPFDAWMQSGGRFGRHTEHLGYLLAEMQFLQRAYPRGDVVSAATATDALAAARELLARIPDPEVPVVGIVDLGIVRDVVVSDDGRAVQVDITPTYSGCPAMQVIADEVNAALGTRFASVTVRTVLSPAWTTDWMTDDARRRLTEYGIAPPHRPELSGGRRLLPLSVTGGGAGPAGRPRACPRCGSADVALVSEFGSTACKAHYRCTSCAEPFDYFKAH